MAFSTLALAGWAFGLYCLYQFIDYNFGIDIRRKLFPARYQVWADCEFAQTPSWAGRFGVIRRLLAARTSGEDVLDDIIPDQMRRVGTTMQQEPMFILTADSENIKAMLATQFKDFATGKMRRNALGPLLGDSIFTSDGSFWEHSRALFRPQFSRDNINDLENTEHAAKALIDACGYTDSNGWTNEVALAPLFFNFTLDTASHFLFSESVDSQQNAIKKARGESIVGDESITTSTQFLDAMESINSTLLMRIRMGIWYWLADSFRFRRSTKFIKTWTERYVQLALNTPEEVKEQGRKTNLLLALATQCKDHQELRNQTLAILFAGRDTTASLLSWIFLQLSINPEIYAKLRKVILSEFSTSTQPTFSQLKSCRYLQHIINETLRLHPTVPINMRTAVVDTTLPVGGGSDKQSPIAIRKGTMIGFSVYIMHRRKDLWGEDAVEFKPERWEQRVPAWNYLPFSGGPRICLGMQFAITEVSYVLVRMCQQFDKIEPIDLEQARKLRKSLGVTMSVRDQVRVRLHKASD